MKVKAKKRNYTALNLVAPYSDFTKSGFRSPRGANNYIKDNMPLTQRSDWLIIETKTLHKHLNYLDEELGLI